MKTPRPDFLPRLSAGFTLIEMIGVLAILAIMASILTPNVLHSIERAAVRAEAETLHNLGNAIGLYLRDNRVLPLEGAGNWDNQIANYASLNAADILTNKRQKLGVGWVPRLYVIDPVVANQRVLLISSMRNTVALPSIAQVKASFQSIWDTASNKVPVGAGWGGWGAGPVPALDNIEYLVIERVSLASIYRTNLATYQWTLNNTSATDTVRCIVTWANGPPTTTTYTLAPSPPPTGTTLSSPLGGLLPLNPGDRLAFYKVGIAAPIFSYVVSNSDKTFTYTTYWTAQ